MRQYPTAPLAILLALAACSGAPKADAPVVPPQPSPEARLADLTAQIQSVPAAKEIAERIAFHAELEKAVVAPWQAAWSSGKPAPVFTATAEVPLFNTADRRERRTLDGITEFTWDQNIHGVVGEVEARYLGQFASIERLALTVEKVETVDGRVTMHLGVDLRGTDAASGNRRNDRGTLALNLVQEGGTWKVARAATAGFESLVAQRAPTFTDATASMKLDQLTITPRSEAIRRGGYAAASADFDNDKRVDLLVGDFGPVRLLRNTGAGYEDVTAAAGIRGDTKVKSAGFVDLDNDGLKDIVMVRYVEKTDENPSDFVAYRNKGDGTFEMRGDVLTRGRAYDRSMPLAVADFDNNGKLDIYVGFPGSRDFTNELGANDRPADVASQGVWLNDGQWNFSETAQAPGADAVADSRHVYPHAALVSDLNRDGRPDILVTDDSGRASPIYYNNGDASFREVAEQAGLAHTGWGMGAVTADYDNDGDLDVYMSQIDFAAARELFASTEGLSDAAKAALTKLEENLPGNALFRNKGDGTFEEVAVAAGVKWAGDAPAVASWVDYNADGNLDLYVPNGLWSGGEQDFTSTFLAASAMDAARDASGHSPSSSTQSAALNGEDGAFKVAIFADRGDKDPNPVLSILREFKGDLANPLAGASSVKPTLSFAGHETNRLFRNNGDGSFTEVGFLEAADRIEDGYVASAMDVDFDGKQDLFLRNCDPAPGHDRATYVMLRNQRADTQSLVVQVAGVQSNADGVGSVVTAWVGDRKYTREIHSVTGAVQSETLAFIGLDGATKVDRLEVQFPSGAVQTFENVPAGRVVVSEGKADLRFVVAAR